LAHKLGCKGITVYRDGSKQQQVLNLYSGARKAKRARDLSLGVSSEYYEIKTGYGPLHIHIDYDDDGPYRVFTSLSPVGTELAGLTSVLGVLLSKYLEEGGEPNQILKHLESIKGDRPFGLGDNKINSIAHAVSVAMRTHLKKHDRLEENIETLAGELPMTTPGGAMDNKSEPVLELWNLSNVSGQCPSCFSGNVSYSGGCSGPVCHDCGYSECS
jgi:ribonucleoside-diphosphate reductase alpha chain